MTIGTTKAAINKLNKTILPTEIQHLIQLKHNFRINPTQENGARVNAQYNIIVTLVSYKHHLIYQ